MRPILLMAQHAPEGNGIEMWRRMLVKTHEPLYKSKSCAQTLLYIRAHLVVGI